MRRWALPAVLAFLLALGAAWGSPRPVAVPAGAGPTPVLVALPAGITQLAVTPRADPRAAEPVAGPPPAPPRAVPGAAPAAGPVRATALSPTARSAAGGRAPPPGPA
jgi:hypothetical protein